MYRYVDKIYTGTFTKPSLIFFQIIDHGKGKSDDEEPAQTDGNTKNPNLYGVNFFDPMPHGSKQKGIYHIVLEDEILQQLTFKDIEEKDISAVS